MILITLLSLATFFAPTKLLAEKPAFSDTFSATTSAPVQEKDCCDCDYDEDVRQIIGEIDKLRDRVAKLENFHATFKATIGESGPGAAAVEKPVYSQPVYSQPVYSGNCSGGSCYQGRVFKGRVFKGRLFRRR